MNETKSLIDFVSGTSFEDLPNEVVSQAKMFILDALGCAIGGYTYEHEKVDVALNLVRKLGGRKESSVLVNGLKGPSCNIALVNGLLIHSIDFDDTHKEALTHTAAPVVAAGLSAGEKVNSTGKDLINAVVLGYEVAVRVGMAVMPSHYKFWHSTATNGTFGAAVAAGKLFGLSKEQLVSALGICGTQAAGLLTYLEFGDHTKSFNPGKSAMNGIMAALLAQEGMTAPPTMLEHSRGYCFAYSQEPKIYKLTEKLGVKWEIMLNSFKPYPSLLASHGAIDAVLKLCRENNIAADDIQRITDRTYKTVKSHFSNMEPPTVMAARLSVPYCIAVAAVDGAVGMEQFTDEKICNKAVKEVLGNVEIVADDELNKLYPEKFPHVVTIYTKDGKEYQHAVYYGKGDPNNPMSEEELTGKFRKLATETLPSRQVDRIVDAVKKLESVRVGSLVSLTFGKPTRKKDMTASWVI